MASCAVEAPCGGVCGGCRWSTPVLLCDSFVWPSLSPYFFSYLGLVQSPSHLRTLMSVTHLLSPQAFVKRAGNSDSVRACEQRAKRAEPYLGDKNRRGGLRGGTDFVLMPYIHETTFWYHNLIGQIADCDCTCAQMLLKLMPSSVASPHTSFGVRLSRIHFSMNA